MMRQAGSGPHADRIRGLIAILWRAGLRISEALALAETDLDPRTGSVLVRCGKGGKRRTIKRQRAAGQQPIDVVAQRGQRCEVGLHGRSACTVASVARRPSASIVRAYRSTAVRIARAVSPGIGRRWVRTTQCRSSGLRATP